MDRINAKLTDWGPYVLSVLRIVAGLLFLQHGLVKLFAFPMPFSNPPNVRPVREIKRVVVFTN
jgi:putative oxidoreductase